MDEWYEVGASWQEAQKTCTTHEKKSGVPKTYTTIESDLSRRETRILPAKER